MKLKKKKGSIEMFISSIAFIMIALIVLMVVRLKVIKTTQSYVEDGLVASNLAAATIDLNEYGTTNNIINNDFQKSFNDYCIALKENLNLDSNFNPKNNTLINSKVEIINFTIYNVVGNNIEMTKREANGSITKQSYPNKVGIMKAPNGAVINTTMVYSKIGFELKGYMNDTHYVYKDNSVDITDKD